ncbi:MAG: hypothetical protein ACYTF1_00710 [Planctomycetota bacterium]|jgi:hypothetical protein
MQKITLMTIICLWGLITPAVAQTGIYTFQPTPVDLYDLDHWKYYTWGIDWTIPPGEFIQTASLFIDNINDWKVETGDIMYIHLLDNPALGVTEFTDNQGGGNNFAGQGIPLTTYTDDDGEPNPPEDWTYNLNASQINTLTNYINNDGRFGLGMDPDCHYFNDGITLTISTYIPEPSTALFGLMTPMLFLLRKRRKAA